MNFSNYISYIITEINGILGFLTVVLILYYVFNERNKKSCNLPPGPRGLPFVGYLPFLGKKPHKQLYELSKKYGNVYSLYLGQSFTVVLNNWSSINEAFNKIETTDRPPGVFDAIPNGLGHVSANGKEWIDTRRVTVKSMRDVGLGRPQWTEFLQEEVEDVIQAIRDTKGQCVDACKIFFNTFTNNIMTLLFDEKLPNNDPMITFISHSSDFISERVKVISWVNYLPRLCNIFYKLGFHNEKESKRIIYDFGKVVENYVDKKMESHKNDERTFIGLYNKEVEKQKNNPNTFFTKKSLYGNTNVLILGGTETTKTAMIWLLKNMAKHQDVQKKVQQELDSVLGKRGKIMWTERDRVPYTFCTIMESLRVKSMIPLNPLRMANADFKLQGYDIPKGTIIILNQWALHNDTNYWPEPRKFKPERFLTEDKKIGNALESFVGFSIGRRKCAGRLIALMELLEYFITIMQNFTVLPPENGFIKYDTILGFSYQATSMMLRFVPREENVSVDL